MGSGTRNEVWAAARAKIGRVAFMGAFIEDQGFLQMRGLCREELEADIER